MFLTQQTEAPSLRCRKSPSDHLPTQRIDQLINLIGHVLHLVLVVAAAGTLAQRAQAVGVVARAVDGTVELSLTPMQIHVHLEMIV